MFGTWGARGVRHVGCASENRMFGTWGARGVRIAEGLNAKPTTLLAGSGYDYSSLLAAGADELLVANRSKDHTGVTMINPRAETMTPTHVETGLPPAMLVLYRTE